MFVQISDSSVKGNSKNRPNWNICSSCSSFWYHAWWISSSSWGELMVCSISNYIAIYSECFVISYSRENVRKYIVCAARNANVFEELVNATRYLLQVAAKQYMYIIIISTWKDILTGQISCFKPHTPGFWLLQATYPWILTAWFQMFETCFRVVSLY